MKCPSPLALPPQKVSSCGNWPFDRPQLDLRYLARFSVFATAAMTALSTDFWSAAFDSGNASFVLGLPSAKNSSSAEPLDFFDALPK
jgi:hypothetical protein